MKLPKLTHSLLLVLFGLLLLPTSPIRPIASIGAEASWHQALAMALANNFQFGTDFIYKYGPLGFLENGFLPEVVHVGAQLLFDLYILFNLLFVIHYALKKAKVKWVAIVALLAMILPWGFIADATFTLLFLFLFNLFHANENHRSFSLYNAVFIAALMFFIKVNFSLVISILLYATLVYLWLTKRFSWRELLAVVITHLFLIYWGAYQLHVDIYNYLVSSIHIIDNYDDTYANILLKPNLFYIILGIAICITVFTLIVFFKNIKQIYRRQDYLYTFLMVFAAMYLSFKQQFTDLTAKNAMAYFLFIPPLLALLWIFLRDSDRWFSRLVIASLVLSTVAFQLIRYEKSPTTKGYLEGFFPKEVVYFKAKYGSKENANKKIDPFMDLLNIIKIHTPYGYVKSLTDNQFTTYYPKYNKQNRLLPTAIIDKIGSATVDVLPSEVSYVFYNKLNYAPRPTIQSNLAVDAYLDHKNEQKITSNTAPEYIFSQFEGVLDRNFLWQETATNLAFMSNYTKEKSISVPQYVATNTSVKNDTITLYQKRKSKLNYTLNQLDTNSIGFNKTIRIPKTQNILILKAHFKYSALGLLVRYLFQAPFVYCNITYTDGKQQKLRAIVPQFETGVIINKKVANNSELDAFFEMKKSFSTVESIDFESKNSWGFVPKIDLKWSEVKFQ